MTDFECACCGNTEKIEILERLSPGNIKLYNCYHCMRNVFMYDNGDKKWENEIHLPGIVSIIKEHKFFLLLIFSYIFYQTDESIIKSFSMILMLVFGTLAFLEAGSSRFVLVKLIFYIIAGFALFSSIFFGQYHWIS